MTTRNAARRRKGATRQVKGQAWTERQRVEYTDGLEYYEREVIDFQARNTRDYWRERLGPQASFIYLIQSEEQEPLKIGYAINPVKRLAELQCGNPAALRIRALILGGKASERALHRHWRDACVRGEWYGRGYAYAILHLTELIGETQIVDYRKGADMLYVRDVLPAQILEQRLAAA